MKAGCGRCNRNVTSKSPLVVTSSRLRYQALRGLIRNFSLALPCSRSQVHLTSLAVNGLPSCHFTPSRNLKVRGGPPSSPVPPPPPIGTNRRLPFFFFVWS